MVDFQYYCIFKDINNIHQAAFFKQGICKKVTFSHQKEKQNKHRGTHHATEAVSRRWFFFSRKNTFAGVSYLFRKMLRLRCFLVNFSNFLRTPILQDTCEHILRLTLISFILFMVQMVIFCLVF